jgi:hypothetical protein
MRKLSVSTLVTLDGVIQDPGGFGETDHGGSCTGHGETSRAARTWTG